MENVEHKTYELTCLSPVHVGNGQVLKQFEYVYESTKKQVRFLDQKKWAQFLVDNGLIDDYSSEIYSSGKLAIIPWMYSHRKERVFFQELNNMTVSIAPVYMSERINDKKANLYVQAKTAQGVPYIPGSSIKGAIRTAILYHLIEINPTKYSDIWREAKEYFVGINRRCDSRKFENRALAIIPDDPQHRMNDSLRNVMKGIKVSDAMSTSGKCSTIIVDKKDVPKTRDKGVGKPSPRPVYRECIAPGEKLRFTLSMDTDMLKLIGLTSLDELWSWVKKYTQDTVSLENQAFSGHGYDYILDKEKQADVFLGAGTGFLTKTVVSAFFSGKDTQELLAKYFDRVFTSWDRRTHQRKPAHHHVERDDDITPRTLKLAFTEEEEYRMGMATIREIKHA